MPKHTDGTWKYNLGFVRRVENEQILAGVLLTGTDGECDANGRLMAAAPRMLQLLKDFVATENSVDVDAVWLQAKRLLKEFDE